MKATYVIGLLVLLAGVVHQAHAVLTISVCGDSTTPGDGSCTTSDGPYQAGQYLPFAPLTPASAFKVCDNTGKCVSTGASPNAGTPGYTPPGTTGGTTSQTYSGASFNHSPFSVSGTDDDSSCRAYLDSQGFNGGATFEGCGGTFTIENKSGNNFTCRSRYVNSVNNGNNICANASMTALYDTQTSCPPGYGASGDGCVLTNAQAVDKPSDGTCHIERNGNTFTADARDPDCRSGSSAAASVGLSNTGGEVRASNGGDLVTGTINADGTITVRTSRPNIGAGTTATATVNLSSPDSDGDTVVTGSGSSTSEGTGTVGGGGSGSGSGGSTGPTDYSRESTLIETNAKLDQLHDDLTTEDAPASDPSSRTAQEITDLLQIPALDALKTGIVVPNATCPTFTIPFGLFGHSSEHVMDAQCDLAETSRLEIGAIMLVAWSVLALFIVLSA